MDFQLYTLNRVIESLEAHVADKTKLLAEAKERRFARRNAELNARRILRLTRELAALQDQLDELCAQRDAHTKFLDSKPVELILRDDEVVRKPLLQRENAMEFPAKLLAKIHSRQRVAFVDPAA